MEHTLLSQHSAGTIGRLVVSACLVPFLAFANPVGESVRFGDVDFARSGNRLDVIQRSNQVIIDWTAFSIANGEVTDFSQPGAGASALNRVTGVSASQIDGLLRSNGRILLLNPNGIVIGPGGRIDTASFVASTLDISDSDFLAGGDLPLRGTSEAAVINLGTISAFDGDVFLVAASVENHGSIFAPNGTAGLAAGNDVLIRESGEERIWVRGASGEKKENGVVNTGTVEANIAELKSYGGNIYGMAVKNEGRVAATGVTKSGGQIFLSAGGGKSRIRNTGKLIAKRPAAKSGGNVSVRTSGEGSHTEIGGTLDVRGIATGGVGGEVLILGSQIDILPDTVILADGESGGGRIQVGGGRRGENPDFNNAEFVNVADGVEINASATVNGDGGDVILFATDTLDFYGHASVRGGDVSGDGGFVELSGKRQVNFNGFVKAADTRALNGENGSLLFDPTDLTIFLGSGSTFDEILGSPVGGRSSLFSDDISTFLEDTGSLEILTDSSGTENGDIFFDPSAVISWTGSSELRMIAEGGITFSAGSGIRSEIGNIYLENRGGSAEGILLGTGSFLDTGDGDITLIGRGSMNGGTDKGNGVQIEGSVTSTGSGSIDIRGFAGTGTGSFFRGGIAMRNATVSTNTGNLTLNGTGLGDAATRSNLGVMMISSTVSSADGDIAITGTGGVGTLDQTGVRVGGTVETTGTGSISIKGTGGSGTGALHQGVYIAPGATVAAQAGNIVIEGIGGTTTTLPISEPPPASAVIELRNPGIHNETGLIQIRGRGDITLRGTAGTSGRGIFMRGSGDIIEAADGNVTIVGKAKGSRGIELSSGSIAAQNGKLTYDGESETGRAADLVGSQASVVEVISRRGDVTMLGSGELYAERLILHDARFGEANFDFSAAPTDIDTLSAETVLGSVKLDNAGALTVEKIRATGSIELEASRTFISPKGLGAVSDASLTFADASGASLTVAGELSSGSDVTLSGEVIAVNHFVRAGGVLKTGAPNEATSRHILNLNQTPVAARFEASGTDFDDVFNVSGALVDSLGANMAVINGGGGFDSLNINTLDLEKTTITSIEQVSAIGNNSRIIGKNAGATYRFSGSGVIETGGSALTGFEILDAGGGNDSFLVESGFADRIQIDGDGGIDTLTGTAGGDMFSITSNNGGNLNSRVRFSSIERLQGGAGNDQFTFRNQAANDSVEGGVGTDGLTIDDTNLGGTNRYSIREGIISRNPLYLFSEIETVELLLGSGSDTVDVLDTSFALSLDGGAGFDTLNTPGGDLLNGPPIQIGDNFVNYANFEAPIGSGLVPNPGNLLENELEEAEFFGQWGQAGGEDGRGNYSVENLFKQGGEGEEVIRFGIRDLAGGAFGASAAVMNLAQQLVTITIDGQQYLLYAPASLDGTFDQPPFEIIERLRENLGPEANGELARALDYTDGAFMVSYDEAFAIDLSGPPPPALLQLLQNNLGIRAAQELSDALGLVIALPLSNLDGPTVIGLIMIPPGAETAAALLEQLGAPAENELKAALGN